MARKRKKMGRPTEKPLTDQVRIRCAPKEKAAWFSAAGGQKAFSAWARALLNQASRIN